MNNYIICNIPEFSALLRMEFLYNGKKKYVGKYIPVNVMAITSLQGRALMFWVMTDSGAVIDRIPIHALCSAPCPIQELGVLQLWDCFSYNPVALEIGPLSYLSCVTLLRDKKWYSGSYLFTVDWCGTSIAENPGEASHKCAHIITLDNGNFAAQPNNRIFWREASFVTKPLIPGRDRPDWETNCQEWIAEDGQKWTSEDTDRMFYHGKEVPNEVKDAPNQPIDGGERP